MANITTDLPEVKLRLICDCCGIRLVLDDQNSPYFGDDWSDADGPKQHRNCSDAESADWQERHRDEYAEDQQQQFIEYLQRAEREAKSLLETAQGRYNAAYNELVAVLQPEKWRELFHTREEIENAPPIRFAIQDFLQDDTVTMLGGLPGHGKTLIALAIVKALLEGGKLFERFEVKRKSERVLYLVPEAALSPFVERLRTFKLTKYIGDRLFVRTLSAKKDVQLDNPQLLKAAGGADIFLDTAIRFLPDSTDENNAAEMRQFSNLLFALLKHRAKTVTGLHHSPKFLNSGGGFAPKDLTLENVLRGSGDLGAMCGTCWGAFQVDEAHCGLYLKPVKTRDFQAPKPLILEGRPSLDKTGLFAVHDETASSITGAKTLFKPEESRNKHQAFVQEARKLQAEGKSLREIATLVGVKSPNTISQWLKQDKQDIG